MGVEGRTIWITGLSGAGKSTLGHEIVARLRGRGTPVVMLDGDDLREVFGAAAPGSEKHDRAGRIALALTYARLCQVIAKQGVTVVIATISMFREIHAWNRANLPGYFEAFLKVPLEELRRRDPKGIYRRFDTGELRHVAGLDLTVDEPEAPDWVAEFSAGRTVETLADELMKALEARK